MKKLLIILLACGVLNAQSVQWKTIDNGFEVGTYISPQLSLLDNSTMTILRVDPELYKFDIMHEEYGHTADKWAKDNKFLAVVNAGMYDGHGVNMGAMKHYDKVYNPKLNAYNAILAFNPVSEGLPSIDILDAVYVNVSSKLRMYNSYTQSIRMVSLSRHNMWRQVDRMWSVVVVAIDMTGKVLFIHCRSPYTMHDFINIVLRSPLDIRNMMYLEGGPEASLYVNHCDVEVSRVGSYETDFFDNSNNRFWNIPNVIGITKK